MDNKQLIEKIRKEEIDLNSQSPFIKIAISGLINSLNKSIRIRDKYVKHYITHTGDDIMYLEHKGQDYSIEPFEISNEDYIYMEVPRCTIQINGIDMDTGQLTSPYIQGICQYEDSENLITLSAEFRRIPLKINIELTYTIDNFTDATMLMQQIISHLAFIRTYPITYMGQSIQCSYKIPTSMQSEYLLEIDGTSTDNKNRTLSLTIELETNMPIYDNKTAIPADAFPKYISGDIRVFGTEQIANKTPFEVAGSYEID